MNPTHFVTGLAGIGNYYDAAVGLQDRAQWQMAATAFSAQELTKKEDEKTEFPTDWQEVGDVCYKMQSLKPGAIATTARASLSRTLGDATRKVVGTPEGRKAVSSTGRALGQVFGIPFISGSSSSNNATGSQARGTSPHRTRSTTPKRNNKRSNALTKTIKHFFSTQPTQEKIIKDAEDSFSELLMVEREIMDYKKKHGLKAKETDKRLDKLQKERKEKKEIAKEKSNEAAIYGIPRGYWSYRANGGGQTRKQRKRMPQKFTRRHKRM